MWNSKRKQSQFMGNFPCIKRQNENADMRK